MPSPITPQRALLARRLRELRSAVFPSGSAMARQLGWHQTRVSKVEQGQQRPTDEDLQAWADAVDASDEQREELDTLAAAARVEYTTFRQRYRFHGGAVADQQATTHEDAATTRLLEFHPAMVPGLLQTPAYAREVLNMACGPLSHGASDTELEATVGRRMERQQILYEPKQRLEIVMAEAALHTRFGEVETLAGQLDRLMTVAGLERVYVGIVPFATRLPIYPLTSFAVYDDHVLIEHLAGQHRVGVPEEVAAYEKYFAILRDAAISGVEAQELLARVSSELRRRAEGEQ